MAENLTHGPFEEEDEEEEEEGHPTELVCLHCMERIVTGEDVALFQLVEPWLSKEDGEVKYLILRDDNDEPLVEPVFFDFSCYEELEETIREQLEDEPPNVETHSVLECDYCGDSIRMGERCIAVDIGEVAFSPRTPTLKGVCSPTTTFLAAEGDLWVACLTCARRFLSAAGIEDSDLENTLAQGRECKECTATKCWRHGRCMCRCHWRPT